MTYRIKISSKACVSHDHVLDKRFNIMEQLSSLFEALWEYMYTWLPTTARQRDEGVKLERKATKNQKRRLFLTTRNANKNHKENITTTIFSSDCEYPKLSPKEIPLPNTQPWENRKHVRYPKHKLAVVGSKVSSQRMRNRDKGSSFTSWLRQRTSTEVAPAMRGGHHQGPGRHQFCYHTNFTFQTRNTGKLLQVTVYECTLHKECVVQHIFCLLGGRCVFVLPNLSLNVLFSNKRPGRQILWGFEGVYLWGGICWIGVFGSCIKQLNSCTRYVEIYFVLLKCSIRSMF